MLIWAWEAVGYVAAELKMLQNTKIVARLTKGDDQEDAYRPVQLDPTDRGTGRPRCDERCNQFHPAVDSLGIWYGI